MKRLLKHIASFCILTICFWQYAFPQVEFTQSNLPIVIINTNGQELVDEPKIVAVMGIIHNENSINHVDDAYNNYYGFIGIEKRGSTSLNFPKNSYSLETREDSTNSINVSLIDMPKENDWILYGPMSDKSLMRNVITYELFRRMGWYATRTKFCELQVNNEYLGVYVLIEKIKRDKGRLDISVLNEDDTTGNELTGGYILRIDRHGGDGWNSNYNSNVYFEYWYPDDDKITLQQENYIKNFITALEDDLYSISDSSDSTILNNINIESFADFIITNELAKNVDAYRLSTYLYKDKDSKDGRLCMGPVWDFNIAFGNNYNYNAYLTEDFIYSDSIYFASVPFWFKKLMSFPYFADKVRCRWDYLRTNVLSQESIFQLVDSCALLLDEAQERNFTRWDILGEPIWPNYYVGETYEEEVTILKFWIEDRVIWIDNNLPGYCDTMYSISQSDDIHNIEVYPNPFKNRVKFDINTTDFDVAKISLYDFSGKRVLYEELKRPSNNSPFVILQLDDQELSEGTYIYNCTVDDKETYQGKLIKMK